MTDLKPSVRATYDSAETGPRYWATTQVGDRTVTFRHPPSDPFVRTTVVVSWWDAVKSLLRHRHVTVTVTVGADLDLMGDVLELDEQALIAGRTRQAAFQQSMHQKLRAFAEETDV